jgi:uncharacterized membrane protein YedE/YeeE
MTKVLRVLSALLAGVTFGFGLSLSGMLDPARVRGFLDVAGDWDPSLMFVLAGAVAVGAIGHLLSLRLPHPAFDRTFHLPEKRTVDARLVGGSALFGIGWGMAGLCPGPAVAGLALGLPPTFVFVAAMIAGMILHDRSTAAADAPAVRLRQQA